MDWTILAQGPVGAGVIVVGRISREDPAQVRRAQDHDVVQEFAPDRTDQSLCVRILPGRSRRDRVIAYAHRAEAPEDSAAIHTIAITDEMPRCLIPRKCLGQLPRNPSAVGFAVTLIQMRESCRALQQN